MRSADWREIAGRLLNEFKTALPDEAELLAKALVADSGNSFNNAQSLVGRVRACALYADAKYRIEAEEPPQSRAD